MSFGVQPWQHLANKLRSDEDDVNCSITNDYIFLLLTIS